MYHSYYVLMDLQEVKQLWRSLVLFDKIRLSSAGARRSASFAWSHSVSYWGWPHVLAVCWAGLRTDCTSYKSTELGSWFP